MMLGRLAIVSGCALGSFALGRWMSPPPGTSTVAPALEPSMQNPATFPPSAIQPALAGRVPFVDLYHSLRSMSAADHAVYLRSLQQLPDGPDRRAALIAFFQCLASINPQAAADLVRQVGKEDLEQVAIAIMAATPAPNTPVLVKMLLDLPAEADPEWRAKQLSGQMFYWAALDPTAVAQFVEQYQRTFPEIAVSGLIQCLAAADPAVAARWLQEHPDLNKEPAVITQYLHGLYQSDPALARSYLIEHATDEAAQPGLREVAFQTFLNSANDAFDFIQHLPGKEVRRTALDGIIDINTELFANPETSRTSLYAGMTQWVTKFPRDEWPTTMPMFLQQWRHVDPEGSASWMAQLAPPTRSAIADEVVRSISSDQLREALANFTGDFRTNVLAAYGRTLPTDPEDRKAIIDSLGLAPEEAVELAAAKP